MGTVIAICVLILVVYAAISAPFYKAAEQAPEEGAYVEEEVPELQILLREKERLYEALKELEFDFETGKLSQGDYDDLKASYKEKAVAVLKAIEEEKTNLSKEDKPDPARPGGAAAADAANHAAEQAENA